MGSILESTKEGSFLAQNIPATTFAKASKFSLEDKGFAIRQPFPHNKYGSNIIKVVYRRANHNLGENLDRINNIKQGGTIDSARSDKKLHRVWQEWYSEKKKNSELLLEASKFDKADICKQMLDNALGDARGDVNFKGENGWTPLHFACLNGNIDLVNTFLFEQADIDAETGLNHTSLHVAAQKGYADLVQVLINAGADFNARDIFQNTALHYASQNGNILI